jgi:hypothetical protein
VIPSIAIFVRLTDNCLETGQRNYGLKRGRFNNLSKEMFNSIQVGT